MKGGGGGRRTEQEIVDEARRLYSADLVSGIEEIEGRSRAVRNADWVASFLDARCAYYVHQNGLDFLEWRTAPVPSGTGSEDVVFVFSVGMGFGSVFPQPSGRFDLYLNKEYLLSFRVTKEDMTWRRDDSAFHYWIKRLQTAPPNVVLSMDAHIGEESMASYGLGFLRVPKSRVKEGERTSIRVEPRNRQASRRWFKLDIDRYARVLMKADLSDGLAAACSEKTYPQIGDYRFFFGDIHAHSGQAAEPIRGCGTGSIDENYEYARDVACLDIFALADHDWQMTGEADWRLRMEKADEYYQPGRFVTLPCFEWTSLKYGHRNVYYRSSDCPFFSSGPKNVILKDMDSPADLWRKLRRCGAQAITVPHHPSTGFFPVDWSYGDPEFERLVEVYSNWGNSEYYGAPYAGSVTDRHRGLSTQDALIEGHRLGFVASSDSHDGNPGNSQWSDRQPHLHHHLGSGLVAVLAPELTREAVFDAMYERRCYATTGTRIIVDFRVNGRLMGSEITIPKPTSTRLITAHVEGTTEIAHIELVRDNIDILRREFRGREAEISFKDHDEIEGTSFYYLRVTQGDDEMAWSSPVWVTPL
ncbi:MAG: DUF3604 domain-containing protein [Candidatus Bathyarchaeia archaeon]